MSEKKMKEAVGLLLQESAAKVEAARVEADELTLRHAQLVELAKDGIE